MKQTYLYFLIALTIYPLLGCQKSSKPPVQLDNNSYITNFELLQKNTSNDTSIKITSPKATLDQTNNIIEIVESSMNDGAWGFSTNRFEPHRAPDGRSIPGTWYRCS